MLYLYRIVICTVLLSVLPVCKQDKIDTANVVTRRALTSPLLESYSSCEALHGGLKNHMKEKMRAEIEQRRRQFRHDGPQRAGGDVATTSAGPEAANDSSATSGGADGGAGRQEGVDFSGTNNQEQGVDEADIVKTDGFHIYMVHGNKLQILGVPNFGELTDLSATALEGSPFQMLLDSDRLVIFSHVYTWNLDTDHPLRAESARGVDNDWWAPSYTKLTVLDITDRAAPSIARELYVEGYFEGARRVNSTVRMISYLWMDIPGISYYPEHTGDGGWWDLTGAAAEEAWNRAIDALMIKNDRLIDDSALTDLLPHMYERQGVSATSRGTIVNHHFTDSDCQNFSAANDASSLGFTSIITLDLAASELSFNTTHIMSNWGVVYASLDTLVIAEPAQDMWWYYDFMPGADNENQADDDRFQPKTNIHTFDISGESTTLYSGSGRVPGRVYEQFALSEKDGNIRVASTTGGWLWWRNNDVMESHVYVLAPAATSTDSTGDTENTGDVGNTDNEGETNGGLEVIGHVGGIGLEENLWSVRFVGDKAYLVTFRQIDPLWTIDLSNPAAPIIAGELEVPGVSTYIHPIAGDKLLTIGIGGDADGLNWNATISLFDVVDFSNPAVDATYSLSAFDTSIGWNNSWSEAQHEHKAFQYWAPKKLLAVPSSSYRYIDYSHQPACNAGRNYCYRYEYISTLELINVGMDGTLTRFGSVNHSGLYNNSTAGEDYWWNDTSVRRSIFMGDYIYAIGSAGVTATNLNTLETSAMVSLPAPAYNGSGYGEAW